MHRRKCRGTLLKKPFICHTAMTVSTAVGAAEETVKSGRSIAEYTKKLAVSVGLSGGWGLFDGEAK